MNRNSADLSDGERLIFNSLQNLAGYVSDKNKVPLEKAAINTFLSQVAPSGAEFVVGALENAGVIQPSDSKRLIDDIAKEVIESTMEQIQLGGEISRKDLIDMALGMIEAVALNFSGKINDAHAGAAVDSAIMGAVRVARASIYSKDLANGDLEAAAKIAEITYTAIKSSTIQVVISSQEINRMINSHNDDQGRRRETVESMTDRFNVLLAELERLGAKPNLNQQEYATASHNLASLISLIDGIERVSSIGWTQGRDQDPRKRLENYLLYLGGERGGTGDVFKIAMMNNLITWKGRVFGSGKYVSNLPDDSDDLNGVFIRLIDFSRYQFAETERSDEQGISDPVADSVDDEKMEIATRIPSSDNEASSPVDQNDGPDDELPPPGDSGLRAIPYTYFGAPEELAAQAEGLYPDGRLVGSAIFGDASFDRSGAEVTVSTEREHSRWGRWQGVVRDGDVSGVPAHNFIRTHGKRGHWIAGQLTPRLTMPKSGTATYEGSVDGTATSFSHDESTGELSESEHDVAGDLTLEADFSSYSVSGSIKNLTLSDTSGASHVWKDSLTFENSRTGSSEGFAHGFGAEISEVEDTGGFGFLSGAFFGPKAEEVGGDWNFFGKDSRGWDTFGSGIFSASKIGE